MMSFFRPKSGKSTDPQPPRRASQLPDMELKTIHVSSVPTEPLPGKLIDLKDEQKEDAPDDSFVMINLEELPLHGEIKLPTQPSRFPSADLLSLILLPVGSINDTWQFYDGMKDIDGKVIGIFKNSPPVTWLVSLLYMLQDVTVNRTYTKEGLDTVMQHLQDKKPEDWETLPEDQEKNARMWSIATNAYAFFSDMVENAYYLKQSGFASNPPCFMFGAIASLANLPTEGLENYLFMRSFCTQTEKAIENAFKILQDHYQQESSSFKKAFAQLWPELSIYLKIILQHPANANLLNKDGKALAATLQDLFDLTPEKDIQTYLCDRLQFKPDVATILVTPIARLHAAPDAKEEPVSNLDTLKKLLQIIEEFTKLALKLFGASQDMISSYVSIAAMFFVTSPLLKFLIFCMGISNAINDFGFSGKVSEEALNAFKESFNHDITKKDAVVFSASLFFAAMIGHAQFKLILDMLISPEAPLPAFVSALITDSVAVLLASGAALRESINYCYYFQPTFQRIATAIDNLLTRPEYRSGLEGYRYDPRFALVEDNEWVSVLKENAAKKQLPALFTTADKKTETEAPAPQREIMSEFEADQEDYSQLPKQNFIATANAANKAVESKATQTVAVQTSPKTQKSA